MDRRRWCVREERNGLSFPISLHRTWFGATWYRRQLVDRQDRKFLNSMGCGMLLETAHYRVARATNRDRAELDGWR